MKEVDEIVMKQLELLQQRAEAEITLDMLLMITESMTSLLSAANLKAESLKDAPAATKV